MYHVHHWGLPMFYRKVYVFVWFILLFYVSHYYIMLYELDIVDQH